MNDFLRTLGQFGFESYAGEESEVSLEKEMQEEIAMEAELDEANAQMDFAAIVAGTSQCESILAAMADREVGLESNSGRDAGVIYGEFGLEAIKDVAMRKAYSGLASLKALINTCIKWLKQLVGIQTASKKIFAGIIKKVKAMKKQLGKVQSKVDDKLKREMPDYSAAMTKIMSEFDTYISTGNIITGLDKKTAAELQTEISDTKAITEKFAEKNDALKEMYDKSNTSDYEGAACYSHIIKALTAVSEKATARKDKDVAKLYDNEIKALEKLRKQIDKDGSTVTAPDELSKYISAQITKATKSANYTKAALKLYVRVADDCLTMAKGIYATLV